MRLALTLCRTAGRTREALGDTVKPKLKNADVLDALYPLPPTHGKLEYIRSDHFRP
ncbi:MAG: hypothetical protein ABJI96_08730 [Paracoccaceae bacterium]